MLTASGLTLILCSILWYLFTTVVVHRKKPRVRGLVLQLMRDFEFIKFLPLVVYCKMDPRILAKIITKEWAQKEDLDLRLMVRKQVAEIILQVKLNGEILRYLPFALYWKISPCTLSRIITKKWTEKEET